MKSKALAGPAPIALYEMPPDCDDSIQPNELPRAWARRHGIKMRPNPPKNSPFRKGK